MSNPIEELLHRLGDIATSDIRSRIETLKRWLYNSYEPNKFASGDFEQRLIQWLDNVSTDEEKKILLRLLTEIFYIGPHEFEELYRCAYQGPISRWLIDLEKIDIGALDASERLRTAAAETWFCPVTDSFRINPFYHINNLAAGASHRPDWRSMLKFASEQKLVDYCAYNNITRLVLLEDFVGGGSQSASAVRFAATKIQDLNVLFVPLIICPDGAKVMRDLESELCAIRPNSLRFEAVMELPEDSFLTLTNSPFPQEVDFTNDLRTLLSATYDRVSGGVPLGEKPYDAYGYPPAKPTGGMVVMYSNTPDNTLPIIHWRPVNKAWNPIFPRHSRDH